MPDIAETKIPILPDEGEIRDNLHYFFYQIKTGKEWHHTTTSATINSHKSVTKIIKRFFFNCGLSAFY